MLRERLLAAALVLLVGGSASCADSQFNEIEALVDANTLGVIQANLKRVDVAELSRAMGGLFTAGTGVSKDDLDAAARKGSEAIQALIGMDVDRIYVVATTGMDGPVSGYLVIPVPMKNSGDASKKLIEEIGKIVPKDEFRLIGKTLVIGKPSALPRLASMRPVPRPDLKLALDDTSEGAMQIAVSMSDDYRRVLRELAAPLPQQLGGGSLRVLADGMQWAAISVDAPPKLGLELKVQTKDAESAAAIRGLFDSVTQALSEDKDVEIVIPSIKSVMKMLSPEVRGDRLVLSLTKENGGAKKLLDDVLRPAADGAFSIAGRAQSMNNLKQLMLAMHNFHDNHTHFPPQFSRSDSGKALLSWRVHLLPYLGETELYQQFKLDEPWDSTNNRKLIERIPPALVSPRIAGITGKKGMTTYLAPHGEQTIWESPKGSKLAAITDGTSNTIGIVEAHPDKAVIWTKPEDLEIDPKDPHQGLVGVWPGQRVFITAVCDGSVVTISETISAETLLHLFQMNDGNPVDWKDAMAR